MDNYVHDDHGDHDLSGDGIREDCMRQGLDDEVGVRISLDAGSCHVARSTYDLHESSRFSCCAESPVLPLACVLQASCLGSFIPPDDSVHSFVCKEQGTPTTSCSHSKFPTNFRPIDELKGQVVLYMPEKKTKAGEINSLDETDIEVGILLTVLSFSQPVRNVNAYVYTYAQHLSNLEYVFLTIACAVHTLACKEQDIRFTCRSVVVLRSKQVKKKRISLKSAKIAARKDAPLRAATQGSRPALFPGPLPRSITHTVQVTRGKLGA